VPSQSWSADDFSGLTPGVDPRRSPKFFALSGKNYVFDSKGPRSDFGDRFLTPFPLGKPDHAQGFRLKLYSGDRVFVMTGDSIIEWDETAGYWRVLFATPDTTIDPHRWTRAYLNGKLFLCHPATGILVYDLESNVFGRLNASGMPNAPTSICVTNGRLCAIDDTFFYFSGTSDGTDWIPRLGGAGFVRISDRVSGNPILVTDFAAGAMVWTTGGVMLAEFTADQVVFRFRAVETDLRPVNSFCAVKIDNETILILDERGLFQSRQGSTPTPYSPLFNEYLLPFIQQRNLRVGQNLRLEWDDLQKRLYLSYSFSFESPIYESAFVLYPAVEKWGQFSEAHYGILPLRIGSGSRSDDYFGFVDSAGRVRYWNQLGSREVLPESPYLNGLYPVVQKPTQRENDSGGYVVSSSAVASPVAGGIGGGFAGYFGVGGGYNAPATLAGLSARIQLGLLRFNVDESATDQLTEVFQLQLGNIVEGEPNGQGFDLQPMLPTEYVGLEAPNFVNCGIRVISTVDGKSAWDSSVPELVQAERGIRYYSCFTQGIWHILELTATKPGEAFRLGSLGLAATYAGKLS
jgi:hypothetical protein